MTYVVCVAIIVAMYIETVRSRYQFKQNELVEFNKTTIPTPLQQRALDSLNISMGCAQ